MTSRPTSDLPSDLVNAERFVQEHGATLRYTPAWGWLVWSGVRWERDATGLLMQKAKSTARGQVLKAITLPDGDARKAALKAALRGEGLDRLNAMITCASTEADIYLDDPSGFDRDPWLLNCLNGTVDLRTGLLRPHDPADLITKLAPVMYCPDALAPVFTAMLDGIFGGDAAIIAYVLRCAGYTLTGNVREKVMFICHGPGANNGKSTLFNVLLQCLGDYGATASQQLLMARDRGDKGVPDELAGLVGKRGLMASETDKDKRLDVNVVKALTGAKDRIRVRELYARKWFEYTPIYKIWLATNHLPNIPDTDNGIWNRIRLIPFSVSFSTDDAPIVGAPVADKELDLKLEPELPGILAALVRGCLDWQAQGLAAPPQVLEAGKAYRMDQDTLGRFLNEHTAPAPDHSIVFATLYDLYKAWTADAGLGTLSKIKLARQLQERPGIQVRVATGNIQTVYGLRIVSQLAISGDSGNIGETLSDPIAKVGESGETANSLTSGFLPVTPCPRCGAINWYLSFHPDTAGQYLCRVCEDGKRRVHA